MWNAGFGWQMYIEVTREQYVANMELLYHQLTAMLAPNGTFI